ncbi:FGGY-family carbohydrate kinase [Paucibacter sp. KCTC 42545]|uniref:FGGY-family carbohydrate kinase n=1 Tax=Paucibacter sp. KCTC 42545 TaxID=1768242 RepID=UPI000733A629|nr:FGGY-family carbohydrate kinase [Paucibacter sp. KCTC 42545]ALT76481.1 carbohydrate kinase [Paucibacter sp. KCTC 42545]
MATPDLLLAIDQGTQSVRAIVFDLRGNLIAKSQQHITPYFSEQPNWAEQHGDYFWKNLGQACQNLWAEHPQLRERIAAVALTCQRASMICLDAEMRPLRPATIWLDSRRSDNYPKLPWWLRAGIKVSGLEHMMYQLQSKAECNWLAADFPEVWAKTRHFVQISAYLSYLLTGQLRDAVSSQVGYVPFDHKRQDWAAASDIKWRALRSRREQMPELVQAAEPLGLISAEAAQHTGIPQGLTLFAAGADKACEVLACGAIDPEVGCISYGTTATINTSNSRYVEPMPFVPAYPAAMPKRYNSEIIVQRGYWMVNWFKREFAAQEVLQAQEQGIAAELLFDGLLEQSPAGAMGLVLQPFWNPGVRFPGPEAKGAVIGFGDVHTRAHLYRAIIEGLGYALRQGKEQLERRNGQPIRRLRVAGGGSQSDRVMQITANIFGLPAERIHTYEASGLGAAINAAVGAGFFKNHGEAVAAMSRPGQVFEPEADMVQLYDRLYREVYRRMYARLSPLYRSIRHITHYPKH